MAAVGTALLLATLVLEILPLGAVMVFAPGPGERLSRCFSYFSLTPIGYADFFPMLTGVGTALAALLLLVGLLRRRAGNMPALVFSLAAAVFAPLPFVFFGAEYMNAASWAVFAMLLAACVLQAVASARKKAGS